MGMNHRADTNLLNSIEEEEIISELDDDEPEPVQMTDSEIEEKFSQTQGKLHIQRNDFLILNIIDMVNDKATLNIAPGYQRRPRWNNKQNSHLIESILLNIPIPPIFLYEHEFAQYEVVDGQQRLNAVETFFDDGFKLENLKKWRELNGRKFSELPPKIQSGLRRRSLSAVIILTESSFKDQKDAMELRQYVFERLNSGGEQLNAQEIRNCIYDSDFNKMLIRIARSRLFTDIWGIPRKEKGEPQQISSELAKNQLYSKMKDCEIVLRYFALSNMKQFRKGMKSTLDNCMIEMKKASEEKCKILEREYMEVLETARDIYGENLFRLPGKSGRRSVPLADAILLAIRDVFKHVEKLKKNREYIIAETEKILSDKESYQTIVKRGNSKSVTEDRLAIINNLFHQAVKK
jgi:hypothetical protein